MNNLMALLNIPKSFNLVELGRTSDGHWLGRLHGDCGFNLFLGQPSFHPGPGRDRSRATWRALSFGDKRRLVRYARTFKLSCRTVLGRDAS